jgi:glycosyltransferase domain-containing protein
MSEKRISIIIPTHERKQVLKRAIAYYEQFDIANIVVCDSSVISDEYAVAHPTIIYHHVPEMGFAAKILYGISTSNTPNVCLSADDDFLSQSGLLSALTFLNEHADYVSVQGMYTQFTYVGKKRVIFNQLYNKSVNAQLESESPEERVICSMNPYVQQLYSLYRKEVLQKGIELATTVPRITNVEMCCNLVPMIFGKHKVLVDFWMARDSRRYTSYNITGNNTNTVINRYQDYLASKEGEEFKHGYAQLFASVTQTTVSKGRKVFEDAFQKYFDCLNRKQTNTTQEPRSIKTVLRKLIPDTVIYLRRKQIMGQLSFGGVHIIKSPEWLSMKKVIVKHGFLEEKEDLRLI